MRRLIVYILPVFLALLLAMPARGEEEALSEEPPAPRDPVGSMIEQILPSAGRIEGASLTHKGEAIRFYRNRGFLPAFSEGIRPRSLEPGFPIFVEANQRGELDRITRQGAEVP